MELALAILAGVTRFGPTVIEMIRKAETDHPGTGRGPEKKAAVVEVVNPIADSVVAPISGTTGAFNIADLRKAVSWTVDALVMWMKVFNVLPRRDQ